MSIAFRVFTIARSCWWRTRHDSAAGAVGVVPPKAGVRADNVQRGPIRPRCALDVATGLGSSVQSVNFVHGCRFVNLDVAVGNVKLTFAESHRGGSEKETSIMGGCCLVVLLLGIGPRLFLVGVWLLSNWYAAFDSRLVAFLGWLFLPYTSLAWMYVFFHNGGRLEGGYLVLLILAVLFDIGVFSGGRRSMKNRPAAL